MNGRPVDICARGVNAFVLRRLAKRERHLIPSQGYRVVGPLQQRLLDLGGCRPLVVGAYGGVNRDWHDLIGRLADSAAPSRSCSKICKKESNAAGVIRLCEQQHLCVTMADPALRTLLAGTRGTGPACSVSMLRLVCVFTCMFVRCKHSIVRCFAVGPIAFGWLLS